MADSIEITRELTLGIDAMGSDEGPAALVSGAAMAASSLKSISFVFFGDETKLRPLIAAEDALRNAAVRHCSAEVSMTDKPMHVLRRGRETSMWKSIDALKNQEIQAVVSGGNTGALMAVSRMQLGMIDGVHRPAVTALWPTPSGRVVVLDVGANVEADAEELVIFAIMGEAFFRVLTGKEKPTVGLLNVGSEDLKGHELIRNAARILRDADPAMDFKGFVEGNDISQGSVDVVVTDGFTGNIALKSAEGAARLVGSWVKDALTSSIVSKFAALLMSGELKKLKERIDPSSVNGGVFLGVNGIVVKSHGGANAKGVASAVAMAANLAGKGFRSEVASTVALVKQKASQAVKAAE